MFLLPEVVVLEVTEKPCFSACACLVHVYFYLCVVEIVKPRVENAAHKYFLAGGVCTMNTPCL